MPRRLLLPVNWMLAVWLLSAWGPAPRELVRVGALPARWSAAPDLAVGDLAAVTAWVVLLWLALGWLAVLGSSARGGLGHVCRRTAAALLPRAVRGLLEGSLGLSVLLSAAPASALGAAQVGPVRPVAPVTAVAVADVEQPLPSLDRSTTGQIRLAPLPTVPAPVLAPPVPAPPVTPPPDPVVGGRLPASGDEVVVRRGDCLWSVVARSLGPDADDAAVARAWPHWYAANRAVIGPDPGLLLPGQRLVPPGASVVTP